MNRRTRCRAALSAAVLGLCLVLVACGNRTPEPQSVQASVTVVSPEWSRDAVIYQINLRQFTAEGTIKSATLQLPRLRELGVDILWLMPIHPIGELNRKGSLGSPYAVRDYREVNPEFGSLEDLKQFVAAAHELGLRVILDWVANHSAWDNPLVSQHPDWYERDWKGDFHPTSWWDWSDIIEFDFSNPAVRRYMIDSMAYWVREVGIDGFRCDVAGYVPLDFWNVARRELDAIKPVFMLAEAASRDLHYEAFDATYGWGLHSGIQAVAKGGATVDAIAGHYSEQDNLFPPGTMRLVFTSNHDKNAWEGTEFEQFGSAVEAAIVLTFVGDGIPMIYNGQEAGNEKRLAFFERDPIVWRDHPHARLFRQLTELKTRHPALHNGAWGGRMIRVVNNEPQRVLSFIRQREQNAILAAFNFSDRPATVSFPQALAHGTFTEQFTGQRIDIDATRSLTLPPWGYAVWAR